MFQLLAERKAAVASQMEVSVLQTELHAEREKHLSTVQELSRIQLNRSNIER